MDTEIHQKTNDFVDRLIHFRPDVSFKSLDQQEDSAPKRAALAASGSSMPRSDLQRLGFLVNDEKNMLIRVFLHKSSGEYRLFFLSENDHLFTGGIVTAANAGTYCMIGKDNRTTIPPDKGIDPIRDTLILTFPDASFSIPAEEFSQTTQENDDLTITFEDDGYIDDEQMELVECRLSTKSKEPVPSKMLYYSDDYIRLVPVENNRAILKIPGNRTGSISCFCYE